MNAVFLIAVPLLAAFVSILVKKISPYLLLLVSFGAIISIQYLPVGDVVLGGFRAPYGINLVVDDFSLVGLYIVNVLFFLVIAINIMKYKNMSSILLVSLAGLNGLLLTGDLFNLFVFIEIAGIAAYLITTTNKKPLATFNYLVQGTVGSSLYLLGLIILYAMYGTLNMRGIAASASGVEVAFPFLLMFIGLGVEAKLLPFNSWVKGILGNSNTLSGPMIASVYATAFGFVFGRLLTNVFVIENRLSLIVSVVIVISIVAGEAMAFASSKLREILLFSSIAQAALVVLLFVNGLTGWAVMLVIANGLGKFVLFLVSNEITEQVQSDELDDVKGLFKQNKVVGVAFTVVVLSVIGLPMFFGFVVKMSMLEGLMSVGYFMPVVILLSSIVEGIYFVRLLMALWYSDKKSNVVSFDFIVQYTVVIIAVLFLVFGVYKEPIDTVVDTLDTANYMIVEGGN